MLGYKERCYNAIGNLLYIVKATYNGTVTNREGIQWIYVSKN